MDGFPKKPLNLWALMLIKMTISERSAIVLERVFTIIFVAVLLFILGVNLTGVPKMGNK